MSNLFVTTEKLQATKVMVKGQEPLFIYGQNGEQVVWTIKKMFSNGQPNGETTVANAVQSSEVAPRLKRKYTKKAKIKVAPEHQVA